MVLSRDHLRDVTSSPLGPQPYDQLDHVEAGDRIFDDFDDADTGRSNVVAFLLGGVVIAGGLLAFLYYDSDTMSTRDITTGSIISLERSAPAPESGMPGLPLRISPAK